MTGAETRYCEIRATYEAAQAKADAAWDKWFTGWSKNGAAASRLANQANYLSADVAYAEIAVYGEYDKRPGTQIPDLDKIYNEWKEQQ